MAITISLQSLSSLPSIMLLFLSVFLLFMLLHHVIMKLQVLAYTSSCNYGPKKYPIIGCLISFYKNKHRLLDWYTELLAASPSQTMVIERLGARRTIVTTNPENIEHILKSNFPNYPKGKPFTDILGDLLGCGIFNADGELWHTQRKLASHEFTTKSLREFVVDSLQFETNQRLLPLISKACDTHGTIDFQEILRRFAFDTICNITLGTDPGFLNESMPTLMIADAFETASMISARRGAAPLPLIWKIKRAMRIGSEAELRNSVNIIHSSIMKLIALRKKEIKAGHQNHDLLSRLIEGGHSSEVIRDMVISFIMAGRDTTSAALTWFFWILSCRPDVEKEVLKEITTVWSGKDLSYNEIKSMKVLEACLCETMRLFPPVAWDSKHAAAPDVLPDGTRVGRGDRVTYFPYGMGRMERIWGKNCAEFDHKRWISQDGEVVKMSPFKFAVFQAGPRVCLGKEMAFVQMKYIAATTVRSFRLKRRPEDKGTMPVFVPLLTAFMAGGLKVVVENRRDDLLA